MRTLESIEERLGRWNRASFAAPGNPSQFTVRWECGCVATGPSLATLELVTCVPGPLSAHAGDVRRFVPPLEAELDPFCRGTKIRTFRRHGRAV